MPLTQRLRAGLGCFAPGALGCYALGWAVSRLRRPAARDGNTAFWKTGFRRYSGV